MYDVMGVQSKHTSKVDLPVFAGDHCATKLQGGHPALSSGNKKWKLLTFTV